MPFLLFKNLPRYECLLEVSGRYPQLDPSACEAFLHLMYAGDQASRVVAAHLAEHNISHGRFMVLMLLFDKLCGCPVPRTPAELADMSQVTRATMTGLVDTLERDGLVTREPDARDRRMMTVTLTAKGRTLLESILPRHFQRMSELIQPLDEAERKMLVQLLSKLSRPTEAVPETAPPAASSVPA